MKCNGNATAAVNVTDECHRTYWLRIQWASDDRMLFDRSMVRNVGLLLELSCCGGRVEEEDGRAGGWKRRRRMEEAEDGRGGEEERKAET